MGEYWPLWLYAAGIPIGFIVFTWAVRTNRVVDDDLVSLGFVSTFAWPAALCLVLMLWYQSWLTAPQRKEEEREKLLVELGADPKLLRRVK